MILYHITPERNLPSILINGLIPCCTKGLTCHTDKRNVVWLTDDPEYILENQISSLWQKIHKPIILKVNCDNLVINEYIINIRGYPETIPHEFYIDGHIDATHIELYIRDETLLTNIINKFIGEPITQQTVEKLRQFFHRETLIPYKFFKVSKEVIDDKQTIQIKYYTNEGEILL